MPLAAVPKAHEVAAHNPRLAVHIHAAIRAALAGSAGQFAQMILLHAKNAPARSRQEHFRSTAFRVAADEFAFAPLARLGEIRPGISVLHRQPAERAKENPSAPVGKRIHHALVRQRGLILGSQQREFTAIEARHAAEGTEPQIAVRRLADARAGVAGEAFLHAKAVHEIFIVEWHRHRPAGDRAETGNGRCAKERQQQDEAKPVRP